MENISDGDYNWFRYWYSNLGVIICEIMVSRFKSSDIITLKSRFYSIYVWFIIPFVAFGLLQLLLRFYPYSYRIAIVIQWVIYIVICTLITFILIKRRKINSKLFK